MKSILLVEDDPLIVEIYTTKLQESGFQVENVVNGKDVFEKLKVKNYDLLVLDIVLPYLTGFEILRKIRKDEKFKDSKVLMLSNLSQKTDIALAKKLGAAGYLIKANFTPSEVIEEIKKILA